MKTCLSLFRLSNDAHDHVVIFSSSISVGPAALNQQPQAERNKPVVYNQEEVPGVKDEGSTKTTLTGMCTCCAPRWGSRRSPQWDSVAATHT